MAQYLANDKYSTKLRTTWIYDPPDSTLEVEAVPQNVPTIVAVGYGTEYETIFTVTGKSGTSSADYTLTGVSRVRGYEGNLASGLSVTCLNNEEFFNQWGSSIAELQEVVDGTNKTVKVTKILDTNGNEVIETPATTDAVNQIGIVNAATGDNPTIEATGDDTNIDLRLKGKGTGKVKLGSAGLAFPNSDGTANQALITDGSGNLSFTTISTSSDGWISAGETWTYASSTSFIVSGDVTNKYSKGDKIKLTQSSTVKYFYVTSVSYSAPNTTVNVTGGSDYTLANATISDNYYSKSATPNGFPSYFNYSPSHSGSNITLTGTFTISGTQCIVRVYGSITGTPTFGNIGLPVKSSLPGGMGLGNAVDVGSSIYALHIGTTFPDEITSFGLYVVKSTTGGSPNVNSTNPFTWVSGDYFDMYIVYSI